MKLYTKTGDAGMTGLYRGERVPKCSTRISIVGDLDELSANIGMLVALVNESVLQKEHVQTLRFIQHKLLDIGSIVATDADNAGGCVITSDDVSYIERCIDACEEKNAPLREFILVGTGRADAQAHICRAVSRRLERTVISAQQEGVRFISNDELLQYINRLSDYFFALGRTLCNCDETTRSQIKIAYNNK
jgi:cob(I)alamin adenosyltransferase